MYQMFLILIFLKFNYKFICLIPQILLFQVKAGLQKVLQVFITNSANVFLLEAHDNSEKLEAQV